MSISKELLSEVLELPIDTAIESQRGTSICYGNGLTTLANINLYELAHLCKEWSSTKGYTVATWKNITTNMWIAVDIEINKQKQADTEPESIFKVCEWILEQNIKRS